jgi:protein-S-isoprenylcysteine O-methyltransferase Ste14
MSTASPEQGSSIFEFISQRLRHGTKAYDLLAALPVIVWYVIALWFSTADLLDTFHRSAIHHHEFRFALRLLTKVSQLIFGALLICLLISRRSPIAGHRAVIPRFLSMMGSYLGIILIVLPVHKHGSPWLLLSTFLICFGCVFSVWSLAWLGRSFSMIPESRKLVSDGPYSFIRHPLYLGEQITLVGIALECTSPWAVAAIVLQFCSQLYRMNYEEDILAKSFPEYKDYMAHTSRFIPWLY